MKVKNRKYGCNVYTHTYTCIPRSESDYKAREARGLLRCVGHYSSLPPLQKYHYMQMRKWKKLYANVSAGNCMQIRVCVLVVGKREYAKQTTELTTIIRGMTSLRSGLKSIRVKGP